MINLSKLNSIAVLLGFTAMIIILSICINTFYWSDDYAFMVKLNQKGVIEYCIYSYNTWDGRFLSIVAFIQAFLLKNIQIEYITFFWTATFVLSGMFLLKIIQQELKLKLDFKKQMLLSFLLTTTFWLGCYKHICETVYWGTGGAYSLDLLLAAVWIYWYLKQKISKYNFSNKFLFFLFSFILGATTQNLTIAILCLIFIDILIKILSKEKKNIGFYSLLFLVTFAGLLFISLAPGNQIRLQKTGISNIDLSIITLFKGFLIVGFSYFKISIVLIFLSIISAFGITFFVFPNAKLSLENKFYFPKNKLLIIQFLKDYKWLFVSLSTIIPFIIGPGLAFPRTSLFFMYFLLIFIVVFVMKMFSKTENSSVSETKSSIGYLIFNTIFILGIGFGVYNFAKGIEFKKFISQRENLLQSNQGKTVKIKLVNPEMESPCYDITDLSLVENDMVVWRRLRLEEYYNVKKIIVEE